MPAAHRIELLKEMYRDYCNGWSYSALARKYKVHRARIGPAFVRQGWKVRQWRVVPASGRLPNGRIAPAKPATEAEIDSLVEAATRVCVPRAIAREWRTWPMKRRMEFISRLRAKLGRQDDLPEGAYSDNVVPFDYGTARAHEIAAKINAGKDSRSYGVKIKLCSQGVIWRGQLWFWSCHGSGYFQGPWTPDKGRPSLHRTIWETHYRRRVPRGCVLRFKDGNQNNLVPENIIVATRNDVVRENQAAALAKQSRTAVRVILESSNNSGGNNGYAKTVRLLRQAG